MRIVEETGFHYRWTEEKDIVAGKEFLMVDIKKFTRNCDPKVFGTLIRLDDPPLIGNIVFYHCMYPFWDGQGKVEKDKFLGMVKEEEPLRIGFWIQY